MTREAKTIARLGVEVETSSQPLVRARQTAEIRRTRSGIPTEHRRRRAPGSGFPDRAPCENPERVGGGPGRLVGHEPDFSETIAALTGCGSLECKKGSLARVDLPDPRPDGTLCWLLPPKGPLPSIGADPP